MPLQARKKSTQTQTNEYQKQNNKISVHPHDDYNHAAHGYGSGQDGEWMDARPRHKRGSALCHGASIEN
jgi:hypothetical protein